MALWLPHASVASHFFVIEIEPGQLPEEVVVEMQFTIAPLHASVAVGGVKVGAAVHSIVALSPAAPIVGGCVSRTVIN